MARPSTLADISESLKSDLVADVHTETFASNAGMSKAWGALLDAADKAGYKIDASQFTSTHIEIRKPIAMEKAREYLAREQKSWDDNFKNYKKFVAIDQDGDDDENLEDWADYRKNSLRYWADRENFPIPTLLTSEAVKAYEAARKAS